ncbi:MAG TPA: GNAT family N-acetyltransferase [Chitinophagaceae bacterium]|nr:GNAT family N-acetyltransferase [Chitinophagaceae bacterium]
MIRKYKPSDRKHVLFLLEQNTPEYFAPSEKKDLLEFLAEHPVTYFVYEIGRQVVGCGGYHLESPNKGRISWNIIHPDYKGAGIGKKLVIYCLEILKQKHGLSEIIVKTSNLSYGFYEKLGFKLSRIKNDYWGKGLDLYQMKYRKQ